MSEKIRFGIIGCGWVGDLKHIPNYSKHPETKIEALCDIDEAAMERAIKKYNLDPVKTYTDYKKMVQDPNIDVVVVATPHGLHCEMTVAAFKAGKHVLCEKPIATTAADARNMIEAAKEASKKLSVGYQWRFRPECLYIKSLSDSGALGEIYYAKAHGLRRRGVPTWGSYMDPVLSHGGALWDGACHSLDLTLWTMNNYEPYSVKANIYRKMWDQPVGNPWGEWNPEKFKVEDTGFALVTMKNGATIYLECAWIINVADTTDMKMTLCGTKAGVDMFDEGGVRINSIQNGKMAITKPEVKPGWTPGPPPPMPWDLEARHWVDCLKNNTEPFVKAEEALVVTEIIEAVYKSAKTGETVYLDEDQGQKKDAPKSELAHV
ncbi:MAG TPA: Gfo/Idh/MocA family oxidoreductase [Terriglobales bacterium]|nr:Gfo/Idh/MocA family oxidoreductase [Terriglobales bacterium]